MGLTRYCSEQIRIKTNFDVSKVTNAVLTLRQGSVVVSVTEFTHPEAGVFLALISGTNMGKFAEGFAKVQLRGFVSGEEFKTNIVNVKIYPVLLEGVITND